MRYIMRFISIFLFALLPAKLAVDMLVLDDNLLQIQMHYQQEVKKKFTYASTDVIFRAVSAAITYEYEDFPTKHDLLS